MKDLLPWLRLLGRYRRGLLAGLALMLLATFAAIGLLALSGWFITAAALAGLLLAAGGRPALDVYVPGGGIRAFALLRTVARYFERLWNHDMVLRLLAALRGHLFRRLAQLDIAQLARFRSAELLQRTTADVDALDMLYLRALAPLLVGGLALIGVGLLLALFAPMLALLVCGGLVIAFALLLSWAARRGGRDGAAVGAASERLRQRLLEGLHGLGELRALGVIDRWRARGERLGDRALRVQTRLATRSAVTEQLAGALVHLAMLATLVGSLLLYRQGAVSAPVAALMTLAVLGLGEALAPLPGALLHLGHARRAARRLNALLALRPGIVDGAASMPDESALSRAVPTRSSSTLNAPALDARTLNSPALDASAQNASTPNVLTLDAVTLRPDPLRPPTLTAASLRIQAGETVALLGPSGSGKSSIANLCARLIDPHGGELRLGGVPLTALPVAALHARIGYLTQRSELFAASLATNLRLARIDADDAALWSALAVAGLDDFVRTLPDGLDTWIGEGGARLSGGQARRLALARVVLKDAPLVLLDEPLSGLDAATAGEVATRLHHWLQGRSALLLAHHARQLPAADRVLQLRDGRIIPADDPA